MLPVAVTYQRTSKMLAANRHNRMIYGPRQDIGVRRAKAALSQWASVHPATAPAGSNRSSHGDNEVCLSVGKVRRSGNHDELASNQAHMRL
jgi:hypothetical protein